MRGFLSKVFVIGERGSAVDNANSEFEYLLEKVRSNRHRILMKRWQEYPCFSQGALLNAQCGHESNEFHILPDCTDSIRFYGNLLCLECSKMILKDDIVYCAACGGGMLPGTRVGLYDFDSHLEFCNIAEPVLLEEEIKWLGCIQQNCRPTRRFEKGRWLGRERGYEHVGHSQPWLHRRSR